MIAHTFTCPQGLYFNSITDGCDFRRNVDCEGKDDTEEKKSKKSKSTTTESSLSFDDEDGEEKTVEEILEEMRKMHVMHVESMTESANIRIIRTDLILCTVAMYYIT